MEPCGPLIDKNSQITSSTMICCGQKRMKGVFNEESESGFEFEFEYFMTDQLLTEILIRLPSNSVCQYKVVCKQWCRIISTSYFISRFINHHRQLNLYQAAPNSFSLVFQYFVPRPLPTVDSISSHPLLFKSYKSCVNINSLPLVAADVERKMVVRARDQESEPVRILASCHDLLLCCHSDFANYYVVNLLTRHWVMLPSHENETLRDNDPEMGPLSSRYLYHRPGFLCYHDHTDINNGDGWYKFKVILMPGFRSHWSLPRPPTTPEMESSQFAVRIYSSESRQWTDFVVDWYPLSLNNYLSPTPILSHNGMLHWVNGHSLVSLDLFSGGLDLDLRRLTHSVKLPDELVLTTHNAFFGVCQGHFRVAYVVKEEGVAGIILRVWELEDYHKGVWQLAHRVRLDKSSLKKFNCVEYYYLISFHPFNKDIVFVGVIDVIYQLNMRTGRSERYRKLKYDRCFRPKLRQAVVTLLHQWFPTPVPSPANM